MSQHTGPVQSCGPGRTPGARSRLGSGLRFAGMMLGTAVIGFGFSFPAAFAGAFVMRNDLFGLGSLVGAFAGVAVGYPLGVVAGIIAADRLVRYHGSLWLGTLGAVAAAGLVAGVAGPLEAAATTAGLAACFFVLPPLLGTLGFHLGRRRSGGK